MFLNTLLEGAYLREDPVDDSEIVILPKGVRTGIDINMVVPRSFFDKALVEFRTKEPISEPALMALGTTKDANDPLWNILLAMPSVVNRFIQLSGERVNAELERLHSEEVQEECGDAVDSVDSVGVADAVVEDVPVYSTENAGTPVVVETSDVLSSPPTEQDIWGDSVDVEVHSQGEAATADAIADVEPSDTGEGQYAVDMNDPILRMMLGMDGDGVAPTAVPDVPVSQDVVEPELPAEPVTESAVEPPGVPVAAEAVVAGAPEECQCGLGALLDSISVSEETADISAAGDTVTATESAMDAISDIDRAIENVAVGTCRAENLAPTGEGVQETEFVPVEEQAVGDVPGVEIYEEQTGAENDEDVQIDVEQYQEPVSTPVSEEEKDKAREAVNRVLTDFFSCVTRRGVSAVCAQGNYTLKNMAMACSVSAPRLDVCIDSLDENNFETVGVFLNEVRSACFDLVAQGSFDTVNEVLIPIMRTIYEE